jgi:outer membrane protein assembly factor BamB
MKIPHLLPIIYLLTIATFFACNKNNDGSTPPGVVVIDSQTQNLLDTVKVIYLISRNYSSSPYSISLTAYNPNKTVRWKRDSLGGSLVEGGYYSSGVIYYNNSIYINGNPSLSQSFLYALDANTGNILWKNASNTISHHVGVRRNDTLFCSTIIGSNNYISALNANTGNLIWQELISSPYGIADIKVDGGIMYFIYFNASTVGRLRAFDLNTRTTKWEVGLTINFGGGSASSGFQISENYITITTGLHNLLVLNKANGTTAWSKQNGYFNAPLLNDSLVYATSAQDGVFAFNQKTGATIWQWQKNTWFIGGLPYLYDKQLYVMGVDSNAFIASLNSSTGVLNWRKKSDGTYRSHVVAGNKIYAMKPKSNNNLPNTRLMILDAVNGNVKDSINLFSDEFGKPCVLTVNGKYLTPNY